MHLRSAAFRVASAMVAVLAHGCSGPTEGSQFKGDRNAQVAILCESRGISASHDYRLALTVRRQLGVEVDWDSAELYLRSVRLVKRVVEADRSNDDGWTTRTIVYTLRGDGAAGTTDIGPLRLRWRIGDGAWQRLESDSCDPALRP